jgi:hypothetical protein
MTDTLHVRAVEGKLCPLEDREGRYCARQKTARGVAASAPADTKYPPMPEGERVPNTVFYRKAVARGDLALADVVA